MTKIIAVDVCDVRFPTSLELHGSDAMVSATQIGTKLVNRTRSCPDLGLQVGPDISI